MARSQIDTKIEHFFLQFQSYSYKKGELILQPDTNPIGAYYLKKGYVREYGISPTGLDLSLHIFMPGSYFPMVWVLGNVNNRYYYEALSDTLVYSAPKDAILNFLRKNPDVLFKFTQRILHGLDKLTSRLEYISFGKAYERVISIIFYLIRHFGEKRDGKIFLKQKFTHRDIAALAGISRETASREWEKLEKKHIISYKKQYIIIDNLESLQKELIGV